MDEKQYLKSLKNKIIRYRDKLNLDSNITFGVEIEYENIVTLNMSYFLDELAKYDTKIKGWENVEELDILECYYDEMMNGEVHSPILIDNEDSWKSLSKVLNLIQRRNGVVTSKCGGHVNIGAHIFEGKEEYYRNFLLLWFLYEKEIYKFSSGEFSEVRKPRENMIDRTSPCIKKYLEDIVKNRYVPYFDKAYDVSFEKAISSTLLKDNVIEFRVPNGTLSVSIWQNYINFFTHFLLYCKKDLDREKILYQINTNDHNAFTLADFIFDEEIDKENFLIQTLKINKIYAKTLPNHIIYGQKEYSDFTI